MRKSAFVAGVAVSAAAGGRWRVQIDVRSQHLYLKEHVLACAQEALFDVLDEMAALRAESESFHLTSRPSFALHKKRAVFEQRKKRNIQIGSAIFLSRIRTRRKLPEEQ